MGKVGVAGAVGADGAAPGEAEEDCDLARVNEVVEVDGPSHASG